MGNYYSNVLEVFIRRRNVISVNTSSGWKNVVGQDPLR